MNLTDLKVKELINNKETFVVDVYGTWCSPCRMVGPLIDKLSEKYKDKLVIGKMDVDENPETTSKFNIRGIPAVLFFKNGEHIDTQVGATSEQVYETKILKLLDA
jgi:thioredoxin 1